jgi:alpha-beta hydrolase superfamily lysophospholipase
MGRFATVAQGLASLGLTAVGYDHLGHGRSDGPRGDAANVDALVNDLHAILPYLLDTAGASRAIVFGHSMGGLILARYLTRGGYSDQVVGGILSAPAFLIPKTPVVRIKIGVGRVLARYWPTCRVAAGIDPNGLSRDPQVVADYRHDPLVHGLISARLGKSLIDDGERYADDGAKLSVPLLVYHGQSDPIASIEGTRRFVRHAPPALVTYQEWVGCRHEPHHEWAADRARVFEKVRLWVEQLLTERPATKIGG